MSDPTVALERTDPTTLSYVERLLDANDLPSADVRSKPERFYVAYAGDDGTDGTDDTARERVGIGGLERYGSDALLRSIVIERAARGNGYGRALCTSLEERAKTAGVDALYLLTTTAESFFAELGYVECERSSVPDSIRETAEFDELCPATAACLQKRL